jgi:hypothetical protein
MYDKLRSARLNVKYYACRFQFFERVNFCMEFVLMCTAPTSAVAGLWFWSTDYGKIIWGIMGIVAALTAIVKPLLNLTKRIKDYEGVLTGYRTLEYDLMELKSLVEQKQQYDQAIQAEFRKAMQREKALVAKNPETRESNRIKRKCEAEVLNELPPENFFVPENV